MYDSVGIYLGVSILLSGLLMYQRACKNCFWIPSSSFNPLQSIDGVCCISNNALSGSDMVMKWAHGSKTLRLLISIRAHPHTTRSHAHVLTCAPWLWYLAFQIQCPSPRRLCLTCKRLPSSQEGRAHLKTHASLFPHGFFFKYPKCWAVGTYPNQFVITCLCVCAVHVLSVFCDFFFCANEEERFLNRKLFFLSEILLNVQNQHESTEILSPYVLLYLLHLHVSTSPIPPSLITCFG